MQYSDKLKDPRWQKKRLEILNRDDFTCQCCSNTKRELHVHHRKYKKNTNPWGYNNFDLTTLCTDCHEIVHGYQDGIEFDSYDLSERKGDYCLLLVKLWLLSTVDIEEYRQIFTEINSKILDKIKLFNK